MLSIQLLPSVQGESSGRKHKGQIGSLLVEKGLVLVSLKKMAKERWTLPLQNHLLHPVRHCPPSASDTNNYVDPEPEMFLKGLSSGCGYPVE